MGDIYNQMSAESATVSYTFSMMWKSDRAPLTCSSADFCRRLENEESTFEFLKSDERCLYFDMDYLLPNQEDFNDTTANAITEKVKEYAFIAVRDVLQCDTEVYALATSHGMSNKGLKYSVRLWFPEITGHREHIQEFIKRINMWINSNANVDSDHVYTYIEKISDSFFDEGIYDLNRKMRCINTSKQYMENGKVMTEDRPLKLIHGNMQDTIISDLSRSKFVIPDYRDAEYNISSDKVIVADSLIEQKYCDYMSLIPRDTWNNYAMWFKIQRASANIGISFDVYDKFMQGCLGYDYNNNKKTYEQPGREIVRIGWGFIYKMAAKYAPEAKLAFDEKYNEKSYQGMKLVFERQHLKIVDKSYFIKHYDDEVIFMTESALKVSYRDMFYEEKDKKGEIVEKPFLKRWLDDNSKRKKNTIGVYPHDTICPEHIFNMWMPFAASLMKKKSDNQRAIDLVRRLISVLCNNEKAVADYIELWIAQMLLYPSMKSKMPVIVSEEGCGKGTFIKLMRRILGDNRVFETTRPDRDVWGQFNGGMKNAYFVILNELSKKQTLEADGVLKGLITDPKFAINEKNVSTYEIVSYHRFLTTTNNDDCIKTSKGDRRKMITYAGDELINNHEFLNEFYDMLKDDNAIRCIYDYFCSLKGADKFTELPIPETAFSAELKEAYTSPIELWIRDYTASKPDSTFVEDSYNLYRLFCNWKERTGTHFECSNVKFGRQLSLLKVGGGIEKVKTTNNHSSKWNIDIGKLRAHFGFGAFEVGEVDNDDDGFTEGEESV